MAFRMDDRKQRVIIDADGGQGIAYFGWEVADAAAMEALAAKLEAAGVNVARGSRALADERHVKDLIVFQDPSGTRIEAFHGPEIASTPFVPGRNISGFRTGPLGMGHVVLHVADIEKMTAFYEGLLTPRACAPGRSLRPPVGIRAGPLELLLDQVLTPDAGAPRPPELRLERTERDPAVLARVWPVTDQLAGELEPTALRHLPLAKYPPATSASHESAPSAIEMSTSCPSPERSRSRTAARTPIAAISAPPPMSAIWPAACIGGPPASPVSAEQADQPEVVHVVARAIAVGAVLTVARDRAVDEARVLLAQALVADAEPVEHARAEGLEQDVVLARRASRAPRARRPP